MWKEYLSSFSVECLFRDPATELDLISIEEKLNIVIPKTLLDLFKETNGVFGHYGIPYIWSTEQMIRENLFARKLHHTMLKKGNFLFFSDAGNGDLFGYSLLDGMQQNECIYCWNHEDGSVKIIAPSLKEFLKGWIIGEISV